MNALSAQETSRVTCPAEGISRRCVADGRGEETKNDQGKPNETETARRLSAPSLFVVRFSLQFSYLPLAMVGRSGPVSPLDKADQALRAHGNVTA